MLTRMSISGGILIFLILVLRRFTVQKLPKRLFVLLWDIALLRLLLPVSIPVQLPANHVTTALRNAGNTAFVLHGNEIPISETASGHFDVPNILYLLWLLGTAVWSVVFAYRYRKECGKIKEALPLSPEEEKGLRTLVQIPGWVTLKKSDQILTPVSFGFIHPRILLSSVFPVTDRTQLKYVLTHELIHVKRMDNLRKLMMAAAVCMHWWNPAVWVMQYLYSRDLELSCDEKVVSYYGEDSKEEYALTLVALAQMKSSAYWFSSGFGKHAVKERIEAIMKFKKITVMTLAVAVLLAGPAITVFAKNTPKENVTKETFYDMESIAAEYGAFGVSYDAKEGHLMYKGQIIGYFRDEKSPDIYTDGDGIIGIIVKRDANNQITGLETVDVPRILSTTGDDVKFVTYTDEKDGKENGIVSALSYDSDGLTGTYHGKQIAGLYDCDTGMYFVSDEKEKKNSVYLKKKGEKLTEITKKEFNRLVKAAKK